MAANCVETSFNWNYYEKKDKNCHLDTLKEKPYKLSFIEEKAGIQFNDIGWQLSLLRQ